VVRTAEMPAKREETIRKSLVALQQLGNSSNNDDVHNVQDLEQARQKQDGACCEVCCLSCSDFWKNSFSRWLNQLEGDSFQFWCLWIFVLYVLELFLISNLIADGSSFARFYNSTYLANNVIALSLGIACTGYLTGTHPSQVEFTIIMKVICTVVNLGVIIFLMGFAAIVWANHDEAMAFYIILLIMLCFILFGSVSIFLKVVMYEIWWFYHHPYTYGVFLSYRREKNCHPPNFTDEVLTDEKIAKGIKEVLEYCGIRVFMDQTELPLGQFWFDGLQNAITSSFLFVPLLSSSAQNDSFEKLKQSGGKIDMVAWEYLMALRLLDKKRIQDIHPIFIGRNDEQPGYCYTDWSNNQVPTNFSVCNEKVQRKVVDSLQYFQYPPPSDFTVQPIYEKLGINWFNLIKKDKTIAKYLGAMAILQTFCKRNNPPSIFNESVGYQTNTAFQSTNSSERNLWGDVFEWIKQISVRVLNYTFDFFSFLALEKYCWARLPTYWYSLLEFCDYRHFGICYLNFISLFLQLLIASVIVTDGNDDIFNNINNYSTFIISISVALGISGYLAGSNPVHEWRAVRLLGSISLVILTSIILSDAAQYWEDDPVTTGNFIFAVGNIILSVLSCLKSVHDSSILPSNYKYGVYLSFRKATSDEDIAMKIKENLEFFGINVYIADEDCTRNAIALSESILFVPIISKEGQKIPFEELYRSPDQFDCLLWEYFMAGRLREKSRIFGIVPIVIARSGDQFVDYFDEDLNEFYSYKVPKGKKDCEVKVVSQRVQADLLVLKVSPYLSSKKYEIGKALDITSNQGLEWNRLVEHAKDRKVPVEFLASMSIMKALATAAKFESFSHRGFAQAVSKSPQNFR
jgi:hypothetical protein